jgi:hypothetical protein
LAGAVVVAEALPQLEALGRKGFRPHAFAPPPLDMREVARHRGNAPGITDVAPQ